MKKKVLTMVMALCMVLCLIPTVAYAEGGTGAVATVENVQALIDALPTAEELESADKATVNQAYISAQEAYDAIEELEPEELAQLTGVEKLTNLMNWFNGQTNTLAEPQPADYLEFDALTGTVTGLKSGYENIQNVVIPDKINGKDVVKIENDAFYYCTSLTSITIEDSVDEPSNLKTIGNGAFSGCTDLESISIPNSVTTIGESAFSGCTDLESISIPNSVTTIEKGAFSGCTGLTSISIPSSISTIKGRAFKGCTSLGSISIPSSVTEIGGNAFEECTGLTSITIEDSVDEPSNLKTIGTYAFRKCISLTSISIPNSVTTIGESAFSACTDLGSISIPSSVTTIGDNVFYDCTGLTSITIEDSVDEPSNLKTIGTYAFRKCISLTSISIPSSVTTIGDNVFYDCTNLTNINVDNGNEVYSSIDGVLFKGCTELLKYPQAKSGDAYTIPDNVTTIRKCAFQECTSLESISIPNSVTTIGDASFFGCTGLKSISIPSSVTTIGYNTFSDCTGLESISIPSSVTTIEKYAFCKCTGLESISIPSSVTTIEKYAFYECTSLTNVYFIGSATEWNGISIGNSGNAALTNNVKYIDVTYAPPSDLVYNGQSKEATVDKNDTTLGDITIKYYDKDKNLLTGSPVDAGRYTVKIDISGTNTYSDIELGKFVITQAQNSFTSDLSIADWTVGETPNSSAVTAKYGTVVYSYSTEKDGTYTETVPTTAGSYWVKASVTETASYKGLEAKKQFNILAKPEPATPTPEVVTPTTPPQIIDGKGQDLTAGEATELSFRSDAAYRDFIRVELDGKTLDGKNYTVREGSTIVTLKAEYVATLSKGEHTISIVSVNGAATTTFTVNEKPVTKSPQTGDDSHIFMWMALLVVSGGLIAAVGICVRKKKFTEE